jgi:CRISPR system Cascade subunit CasE
MLDGSQLMRFVQTQHGLHSDDDGFGYALHAWLAALFGVHAPKPFRFLEPRGELLGYSQVDAQTLLEHARAFASPHAFAALVPDSLATKALPASWREGLRLQVNVLACPITRKNHVEKDVYLRTLDRLGDEAPPRPQVYTDWFVRQWGEAVQFEHVELVGFTRRRLLRRPLYEGKRQARRIERPQANFSAIVRIADGAAFLDVLARGIGRHRAFGYGMVLLSPAP